MCMLELEVVRCQGDERPAPESINTEKNTNSLGHISESLGVKQTHLMEINDK